VIGILGEQEMFNIDGIVKVCKDMSKKEVKLNKKNEVKF